MGLIGHPTQGKIVQAAGIKQTTYTDIAHNDILFIPHDLFVAGLQTPVWDTLIDPNNLFKVKGVDGAVSTGFKPNANGLWVVNVYFEFEDFIDPANMSCYGGAVLGAGSFNYVIPTWNTYDPATAYYGSAGATYYVADHENAFFNFQMPNVSGSTVRVKTNMSLARIPGV